MVSSDTTGRESATEGFFGPDSPEWLPTNQAASRWLIGAKEVNNQDLKVLIDSDRFTVFGHHACISISGSLSNHQSPLDPLRHNCRTSPGRFRREVRTASTLAVPSSKSLSAQIIHLSARRISPTVAKPPRSISEMSSQPIKVAVVGTGSSLTVFHHPIIKLLPDRYVLHAVVERSGKETCRESVGPSVKIVRTLDEVLDDVEVDLVVVSSPNKTHYEYCSKALEKGKHGKASHHLFSQVDGRCDVCWIVFDMTADVRSALRETARAYCSRSRGVVRPC